jgi:hypothetical protein
LISCSYFKALGLELSTHTVEGLEGSVGPAVASESTADQRDGREGLLAARVRPIRHAIVKPRVIRGIRVCRTIEAKNNEEVSLVFIFVNAKR